MWEFSAMLKNLIEEYVVDYIDIDFTLWMTWFLFPLLITFVLPLLIAFLLYVSALVLYIYKLHWITLKHTFDRGDRWDSGRKAIAALWDAHGWLMHSYEVKGMENLCDEGPALIIYYHGAIPIDVYYFLAKVLLYKNRVIHTVADHFLFKIPGFSILSECMKVIPGTVQTCANILKEGNILAISPGGVYEAQFSHQYNLMWKKRMGFAKVAIEAKVPVIPMFTQNLREAFRVVSFGRKFFLRLYALTKFPFAPIYGGFPVKMISYVGKPIPYDPNITPEQLQEKVAQALNELIIKHQRIPGSIFLSILDRFPFMRKWTRSHEKSQNCVD